MVREGYELFRKLTKRVFPDTRLGRVRVSNNPNKI